MIKRNQGHIVAVSSLAGFMGIPKASMYGATKHGLIGLMESLHYELEEIPNNRVKTSVICPYFVNTSALYQKSWNLRIPELSVDEVVNEAVAGIRTNTRIIASPAYMYYMANISKAPFATVPAIANPICGLAKSPEEASAPVTSTPMDVESISERSRYSDWDFVMYDSDVESIDESDAASSDPTYEVSESDLIKLDDDYTSASVSDDDDDEYELISSTSLRFDDGYSLDNSDRTLKYRRVSRNVSASVNTIDTNTGIALVHFSNITIVPRTMIWNTFDRKANGICRLPIEKYSSPTYPYHETDNKRSDQINTLAANTYLSSYTYIYS
ncbi:all-trans-retinol dehydrogenase (NAD(+)) [Sarracenia purpurea var. burkii]